MMSFTALCLLKGDAGCSSSKNENEWEHIRMISEGSCDTEDWTNDAENSALHFKIY